MTAPDLTMRLKELAAELVITARQRFDSHSPEEIAEAVGQAAGVLICLAGLRTADPGKVATAYAKALTGGVEICRAFMTAAVIERNGGMQ